MSGLYLPECRICHRTKKPIGRDAPLSSNYCDHECEGYRADPVPPSFWSREEELETRLERAEEANDVADRLICTQERGIAAMHSRLEKLEEWKRQGMQVIREVHEALQEHGQLGESSADCIRRLAARVAELEATAPGARVRKP